MPSSVIMRAQAPHQLLDDDRGEPLQRLVEQQQRRVGHQRARGRQHLLLAAGELVALGEPALADAREQVEDRGEVPAAGAGGDREVLLDREVGENLALLRHPADAGARAAVRRQPGDVGAAPADACRG